MSRLSLAVLLVALGLTGCGVMEQYHFPQTQDKVPVNVIVAYSEDHPNEVIKSITQSKMYDGKLRYTFLIADSKGVEKTVRYDAEGKKM
ncbi:MAG TPA: hypothetical protein VHM90_02275 [Phycisphaerae bacterium]|jgi:hypothetical protein|nr:hypothetical protein [Phycisphaerae bacterium]